MLGELDVKYIPTLSVVIVFPSNKLFVVLLKRKARVICPLNILLEKVEFTVLPIIPFE